jgi:dTDP-4-amino-4,6-dideoxygalactose transaminase
MAVPFLDLKRQHGEIEAEIAAALTRVISGGVYILGGEVEAFEAEWANFCRARSAAAVGNGTDALALALVASGAVRRGRCDEVVTSTLSSAYTALAILNAGGVPVFADINPQTLTLDPRSVEEAITQRTRAIVPVHLYGQMADMHALCEIARRHDLIVIEDAAQAHGAFLDSAAAGTRGHAAAYSFYPTKNLGAYGDGGAVISDDMALIERVKTLRQGGHPLALAGCVEGRNSRLDEAQAAVLRVKLRHLPEWNRRRRAHFSIYNEALDHNARIKIPRVAAPPSHAFHLYVIQHPSRDALRSHLRERGIETLIHYPYLLHQQTLFQREGQRALLPVAERIAPTIISLPLYPQLEKEESSLVADVILDFESGR